MADRLDTAASQSSERGPVHALPYVLRPSALTFLALLLAAATMGLLVPYSPTVGVAGVLVGSVLLLLLRIDFEVLVFLWILSLPFYAYRFEMGPITGNVYRVMFLFFVLVLPLQFSLVRFHRCLGTYLRALMLFGLFVLDLFRSTSSDLAISSFLSRAFGLGAFVYLMQFISNKRRLRIVTNAYLVSSIIVAGYGVYEGLAWFISGSRPSLPFARFAETQIAFKSSEVGGLGLPRVESFFHDANLLGIYVLISFLLVVSRLRKRVSVSRSVMLVGVLIMQGLCILFTTSRSANGLLVVTLLLLVFSGRRILSRGIMKWGVGLLIVFLLAIVSYSTMPVIPNYIDAIIYRLSAGVDATRLQLGLGGWKAFLSSPISGVGLSELQSQFGLWTTHSFYITVLAKYGLVGVVIVGVFLWPLVRQSICALSSRHNTSTSDRGYAVAAIGLLVYQLVYDNLFSELMWLPFSILYGWALLYRQERQRITYDGGRRIVQ